MTASGRQPRAPGPAENTQTPSRCLPAGGARRPGHLRPRRGRCSRGRGTGEGCVGGAGVEGEPARRRPPRKRHPLPPRRPWQEARAAGGTLGGRQAPGAAAVPGGPRRWAAARPGTAPAPARWPPPSWCSPCRSRRRAPSSISAPRRSALSLPSSPPARGPPPARATRGPASSAARSAREPGLARAGGARAAGPGGRPARPPPPARPARSRARRARLRSGAAGRRRGRGGARLGRTPHAFAAGSSLPGSAPLPPGLSASASPSVHPPARQHFPESCGAPSLKFGGLRAEHGRRPASPRRH